MDRTDKYRQESQFIRYYPCLIVPEEGFKKKITLSLKSFRCITNSSNCPIGNVFDEYGSHYADFTASREYIGVLSYFKKKNNFDEIDHNPITLLDDIICRRDFIKGDAYRCRYSLRLTECDGYPLLTLPELVRQVKKSSTTVSDAIKIVKEEGRRYLAGAMFDLILHREVEVEISLEYKSKAHKKKTDERKKEQTENNEKVGNIANHSGWTRGTTKYKTSHGMTLTGKVISTIGQDKKEYSAQLETLFEQNCNKVSMLNNIDLAYDKLNNVLSSEGTQKYPVLKAEFNYPKVMIKGSIKTEQQLVDAIRANGLFSIGLSPLFGFKFELDLLSAFATYANVDFIVERARGWAAKYKEDVESGKNGAYAEATLKLTFNFDIEGYFDFVTDDDGYLKRKGNNIGLKGEITGDANIEAGINYWHVQGFFKAGADFTAIAKLEFDNPEGGDLAIVFFHEGVKATTYYDYKVGNAKVEEMGGQSKKKSNSSIDNKDKIKEWIIYDELPKDKSNCRWIL